ncbi:Hypothetical predicted protein, partial [Mytilus galloprovincialis]
GDTPYIMAANKDNYDYSSKQKKGKTEVMSFLKIVELTSKQWMSISTEHTKNRTREGAELLERKTKLSTLQSSLKVKGEFITTVRNATRGITTKGIVIKGKINSPPLIGKKTLIELGMLQIQEDGTLKEPNGLGIQGGNTKFQHKIPDIRNKAARTKSNHISNKTKHMNKKITQRDKNTRAQGDKECKQNVLNKHSQKRRYREHSFKISDRVLYKQKKRNK